MTFKVHSEKDAPPDAKNALKKVSDSYGFQPNIMGIFAEAPPLLDAYVTLGRMLEKTSLSPAERYIVMLTASSENDCEYCVAADSAGAKKENVPDDVVSAIRDGRTIADSRLEAFRQYARDLMKNRGRVSDDVKNDFLKAGYGPQQALEIVLGIGMKTLSNYTSRLSHTPLDSEFRDTAWRNGQEAA